MEDQRWRDRRRAAGLVASAIAVGLVGAWLGMALLARTTVPMGPFRVELDAGFGPGETHLELPPFGALTADTHLAPLTLSATLTDVGVERLTEIVRNRGVEGLVQDLERDGRARLEPFALRAMAVGTLGGAILSALVFRRRWRLVTAGLLTALVAVSTSEVLVLETFQPGAFAEPTYSGSLGLAPDLIGPVRSTTNRFDDLRAGLEQVVEGAIGAYTTLQTTSPFNGGAIRVLHVSDVHASPLGMDFAQDVARGFGVDMVIDTGDLTSFGTPVENLIVSRIAEFGVPYVFVRGNHDSIALQTAVAREPNAIVLDGRARTVDGLTIYGLGHPAFTPARGIPVDSEEFAALARKAGETVSEDVDRSDQPVDVVAVHDDRMAEAGRVPLVISGHFHETKSFVENGTLFLRIGTTGGSGAGIFRGFDVPLSAEVLYFSRELEPRLIAYDVIEQDPDTGSLTVTRVNVQDRYGDLELTPTPTPTPTASMTTPTGTPTG